MNFEDFEKKQIEWHLPGYQFCGPGTHVCKRLKRGDRGINELDYACMIHDIEYYKYAGSNKGIRKADNRLRKKVREMKGLLPFLVDKVFMLKALAENLGLWTPAGFARGLAPQVSLRSQRKLGKSLYAKYVSGSNQGKEQ